jgi:hypothetical protein
MVATAHHKSHNSGLALRTLAVSPTLASHRGIAIIFTRADLVRWTAESAIAVAGTRARTPVLRHQTEGLS